MNKIAIYDVDSKIPNLALMKIVNCDCGHPFEYNSEIKQNKCSECGLLSDKEIKDTLEYLGATR